MGSEDRRLLRRPVSLAWRVTGLVGIAMLLVFLVFNWISVRSLDLHFAEMDEEELEVISNSVIKALGEMALEGDQDALERAVRGHHGVYYYVADSAGTTLYAPEDGPDLRRFVENQQPLRLESGQRMTVWEEAGHHYRGAVLRVGDDQRLGERYTIAVAMDIGVHLAFIRDFKRIQGWTVLVVMCLAILVAWIAVRWGHIPIRKANQKIRAITSSRLHVRLDPGEVPIELEETISSFNAMLGRLEDGYAQLANVSADIAHELRTPVTNLTTQTEVAVGQVRPADEYREILYSNLEELGRLNRMINDMLFLAQTENSPENIRVEELDVAETIQGLFEYFDAWVEDRGVSLQLLGTASHVHADKEMLRRALSNLLSNAIRYTPSGKEVSVRVSQGADATTICVENPGPRIDPKDLANLFSRFYRADPSRQRKGDGAGLGLAIVKTIVDAHGGEVYAESDDTSTRFYAVFPLLAGDRRR
ncbi:MAG TPA: Cu(+)/Ag(+) sensor histidine kinase [Candidatus Luteimonas excrementigallinarum]|nr:Cu(+)/Ag(+) sensor histidine kinase [Candidatus Luteimonas excrementigallinarum]